VLNCGILIKLAGNLKSDVNASCSHTMSYPPYGGQGGYPPAPAAGYPQPGQPGFPVCNCVWYVWGL